MLSSGQQKPSGMQLGFVYLLHLQRLELRQHLYPTNSSQAHLLFTGLLKCLNISGYKLNQGSAQLFCNSDTPPIRALVCHLFRPPYPFFVGTKHSFTTYHRTFMIFPFIYSWIDILYHCRRLLRRRRRLRQSK